MGVSLKKGQGVSLKKTEFDLSLVTIGLGWDVHVPKSGSINKEPDYDLDVVAFLCGQDGKVHDLGKVENGHPTLNDGDIVFFNCLNHKSGSIWLTGDNRIGDGDGDDEQIITKLNQLPEKYTKIVFVVQIYNGTELRQSFEKVNNAYIRATDAKGKEMVRFDLTGGVGFADCRSMLFAELERKDDEWHFHAIGKPAQSDTFVYWLRQYIG